MVAAKANQSADRIRAKEGLDLTRLDLSAEEGMVAARIASPMTVSDVGFMMGWDRERALAVIVNLVRKGALEWVRRDPTNPRFPPIADGKTYPAPLMNAVCDLNESERKRILWICSRFDDLNHYDVLDAEPGDDEATIIRKYRERVLEWHPDRWRRDLGPFKRMIDEIYRRVREARSILCDPELRAAYDQEPEIARLFEAEGGAARPAGRASEVREEMRKAERAARRRRRNPIRENLNKAKHHAQQALRLEANGEMVEALRAAQMALTFDQRNETYQQHVDRLTELAAEARIKEPMRRGRTAESMANWDRAIAEYEYATKVAISAPEPKKRLAYNMIMGGRNAQEALSLARKATADLPEDPEAHFVLGLCYEHTDMRSAALSAFSRAIELKPNFTEAKKRSRRLRWGLGF